MVTGGEPVEGAVPDGLDVCNNGVGAEHRVNSSCTSLVGVKLFESWVESRPGVGQVGTRCKFE